MFAGMPSVHPPPGPTQGVMPFTRAAMYGGAGVTTIGHALGSETPETAGTQEAVRGDVHDPVVVYE